MNTTISLFEFNNNKPPYYCKFYDAIPLLYNEIEKVKEFKEKWPQEVTLPTIEFVIGKDIDQHLLHQIFKDIYTISNVLFSFGLRKGAIIFDPQIDVSDHDKNICVYLNCQESEIDGLRLYDMWGHLDDNYFKPYSAPSDFDISDDPTYQKLNRFKSCNYLGMFPIIALFNSSLFSLTDLKPNTEFRLLLEKDLNAKWFDRISYLADFPNNKRYSNDLKKMSINDGPRMCDICRDVGSCLGIQNCGFMY